MARRSLFRMAVSIAAVCLFSYTTWAAELSEAERKQRCENNLARLAELERRLPTLKMSIPDTKWRTAENHITEITQVTNVGEIAFTTEAKGLFTLYATQYGYPWSDCVLKDIVACGNGLREHIKKLLLESMKTHAEISVVRQQIQFHETNLVALGCVDPVISIAGTWQSNWGTMQIEGDTGAISGSYDYQGGKIGGVMKGRVFDGYWAQTRSGKECKDTELGSKFWGRVSLTFAPNGKSFSGTWGYCGGPLSEGGWSGNR